ncbi:MAG: hypothetical protein HYY06_25495 [Deltaproteobacteria bacterium]|nr:hypothetical protein [Deltaproteobacteria bacterium]
MLIRRLVWAVLAGLAPAACQEPAGDRAIDAADAQPDAGDPAEVDAASSCVGPEAPSAIDADRVADAWQRLEPRLRDGVITQLAAGAPYVLYDTQLTTANLLIHAEYARDVAQLEGLARVYGPAFDALVPQTEAHFYWASPGGVETRESVWPLSRPARMWNDAPTGELSVGHESVLVASQFLYAAARLVRVTAEMPRPPGELSTFAAKAVPVIVDDHYRRWIETTPGQPGSWQVRGWACNSGTFSHREHLDNLLHRRYGTDALPGRGADPPAYCNALTDVDLWMIAGVLEVLAAHQRSPALVPLAAEVKLELESYVALGLAVVKSRFGERTVQSPSGPALGLVIDPGGFDGHPDYDYSGYTETSAACSECTSVGQCTCAEFPGWVTEGTPPRVPPQPLTGVSWDISHARRLVSVFDSFRRHRALLPTAWADASVQFTDEEARAFARQIAFGVWSGDLLDPQFATFLDGTNGWYRVNYSNRPAFGYQPFAMTASAPLCGYAFWKELEPALGPALSAAFARIDTPPDTTDEQAMKIIQALPEAMPYRVEPNACGW